MNLYAFNEHNLNRTNWGHNIDNSIMKCINQEIADNQFKASRWCVQSILADVDLINFAFVTRKDINDPSKGASVVASHVVPTKSWCKQLNMNMEKGWRILQHLCMIIEKPKDGSEPKESGEYVILKDFNRMSVRLYETHDNEEEEEGTEPDQIQA